MPIATIVVGSIISVLRRPIMPRKQPLQLSLQGSLCAAGRAVLVERPPAAGMDLLKGKQVPVTLYLAPRQYWLLKSLSARSGFSMQFLLRPALFEVLSEVGERTAPRPLIVLAAMRDS